MSDGRTIEIVGVRQTPSKEAFVVYGQRGPVSRQAEVDIKSVADAIGGDPSVYDLVDLVPMVVTLALPKLQEAFTR